MKTRPKKNNRPYRRLSYDFSGDAVTDTSFGPACDVNAIVRHYENTGIDPFIDRISQARTGEASTIPYEQAMRAKADIDSAFFELPQPERLRYENNPSLWFDDLGEPKALTEPLTPPKEAIHSPAEPPPEAL